MSAQQKRGMRIPVFENTSVGRLKQKIYQMTDKEIGALLKEYEIPSGEKLKNQDLTFKIQSEENWLKIVEKMISFLSL